MSEYRVLTVKEVRRGGGRMNIEFEESDVTLDVQESTLFHKHKIDPNRVLKGRQLAIQGRQGNDDAGLWGVDTLMAVKLIEQPYPF